jgi:adenylate kinase
MNNQDKITSIKTWLGSGTIILFGRPFAGKDFQSKQLARLFGGNAASSGDILRNSVLPKHAEEAMAIGELIPTIDFVNVVLPYLSQPALANKPLILSSFGRWHGEEDGVIKAIKDARHPLKAVIYLEMSDDDIFNRWNTKEHSDRHNRADDSLDILKKRLAVFSEKTAPVLDYYRDLGLLMVVNGRLEKDEVTDNIISILHKRASLVLTSQ